MKHFETEQNGNSYVFYCDWQKTRNGFKHVCELYVNGYRDAAVARHYLNRTWERYNYQSVMLDAIGSLISKREDFLLEQFKNKHDYSRMTAKRHEEFEKVLDADDTMRELRNVEDVVENVFSD